MNLPSRNRMLFYAAIILAVLIAVLLQVRAGAQEILQDGLIDEYTCECDEPVGDTRDCYCTLKGVPCGDDCEYFYRTEHEGITSLWHLCAGYARFMSFIYRDGMNPSVTPTPKPTRMPTPTATATPPPVYVDGFEWVYVSGAFINEINNMLTVAGVKPGYCYDVLIDHVEDDRGLMYLKAKAIDLDWCHDYMSYNPDAPWPPLEYGIPPTLPPEWGYGEVMLERYDFSMKIVCGPLNCVDVVR